MKKINYLFVLLLALSFGLILSCNEKEDEPIEPVDVIDLQEEMKPCYQYLTEEMNRNIVADDYALPTTSNDVTITWESLNPQIVSDSGNILVRPSKVADVTFSYSLNDGKHIYYDELDFKVYPKSFVAIAHTFENQFGTSISEDKDIATSFEKYYTVTWTSSNPEVFSNEGKYTKPLNDTEVTINYRVSVDKTTYQDFSLTVLIMAMSDMEKVNETISWISYDKIGDLCVTKNLELPTTSACGAEISWWTSNNKIIDLDGNVYPAVFDRYVELIATITTPTYKDSVNYQIKVLAKDISNMSEEEILNSFLDSIAVSDIGQVKFVAYTNICQSFNIIPFFDNVYEVQNEQLAPTTLGNVPGTLKTSTEFICVHDTANNNGGANAKVHANYVEAGGGGTSFQYVVGNDGIYHLVENDQVAYHAGDGTRYNYKLYDTGVKATALIPIQGISTDGYFTLNNEKTSIKVPDGANSSSKICSTGVYVEVLPNGNYGMNECYFNTTYSGIANRGGNNNSIGIETCVDQRSDYFKTCRYNADLISRLCTENNLSVDRVLQHNSFSYKPCPMALRVAKYWQNFRDLISLEKFGMEHFKGLTFEWYSTCDYIDNEGYISKATTDFDAVTYGVKISKGDNIFIAREFKTIINR